MSAPDLLRVDGHHPARPLLTCEHVRIGYGDATVIDDLTLSVSRGEVLAVMGPNGAGKTTLLNGIMGLARVSSGRIDFDGGDLRGARPEQVAARGIAYVPQGRWLFPYSSGAMNVWSGGFRRPDRRRITPDVDDFFDTWPAAKPLARKRAELMSGGQQQIIAIGRALMARPRLLLLDEPSLGLAPILVKEVFSMIGEIAAGLSSTTGTAVVLVEQNVAAALHIADHICLLSGGVAVHQGPRAGMTAADIGERYLH
jgi:branched-chain amino acid transport system ATP-binding protein